MTIDDYKANLHSCSSILTLLEVSHDRISEEESDKITMELARFMHKLSGELCGEDMSGKNQIDTLNERIDKMDHLLSELKWLNGIGHPVPDEIIELRIGSIFMELQMLISETKEWYQAKELAQ